jgi:hypothetical protein
MGATSKWHFFPSESPKIGTLVVPKIWMLIFFSNQACFEHVMAIIYNLQKNLSNNVLHTSIRDHLPPALNGFVVRNQIIVLWIITHAFQV